MDVVLLLSGGVESTTLLYDRHGERMGALFIDYGQRAARREQAAAQDQCATLEIPLAVLDAADLGRTINALRPARFHVPLPNRNLFALATGANWASAAGAHRLYLAVNAEDRQDDRSADPRFLTQYSALIDEFFRIQIETPFVALTKADIFRHGRDLGVDYGRTYSCLRGRARHCGRCPQCLKRHSAAVAAGVDEPKGFYEKRQEHDG